MQGNQRAALAANEHKLVKGADQDEALQLAFWRLHAGRKAWKDMHPTRPALVPGTLEFRKSILEKVFSEKELQAGQHTFMMTHGDNITMLDEMYRVRYFRIAHNVSLNQLARALGRGEWSSAKSLEENKPVYRLDHIIKERCVCSCLQLPEEC